MLNLYRKKIMGETWYKEFCPKCDTYNWICDGDPTDLSGMDVEGLKCRKCSHIWYLGGEENYKDWAEISGWESVEDCNWEEGLENPT